MRDVRDWNKHVELVGKSASKRTAASGTPSAEPDSVQQDAFDGSSRRGRGPRKEETREELLARLLDPTLTLEETARILEVCPTTVRRYTNKGILPHQRSAGNQRRFKLSTVLDFEARMRSGAADDTALDKSAA